jgi:outer membrane protein assembly factor BamA
MTVGSGLALGGGYRDTRVAGTPLGFDLTAMASPRRYQLYRARFGLLDRRNDLPSLAPADENLPWLFDEGSSRTPGTALYGEVTYRKYPQLALYHGNSEAVGDDRTAYGVSGTSYDVVAQRQVSAHLAVTSRVGLLQPTISTAEEDHLSGSDTVQDRARGAGLGRQPDLLTLGIGATLDTRDRADRPTAGNFVGVALWQYQSRGAQFGFTRLTVDARQYVSPFGSIGVLALRALVSSDLSSGADRVPFYLQHTLGGDALRGFGNFRLRDNSLAYLTAEYRVKVHAFLDLVPFVEAGAAGSSFGAAVSSRVYADAGVGARFNLAGRTFLRVDWAHGREGSRVSIGTGVLF